MKLSTRIFLAFTIVLVLSILDTTSNYLLSLKVEQNMEFLNKSQEIMRNSTRLHKTMIEMQSSFRGYLLTRESQLLTGYINGIKNAPTLLAQQRRLVKGSRQQQKLLDSIDAVFKEWVAYSQVSIDVEDSKAVSRQGNNYLLVNKNQIQHSIDETIRQNFVEFDKLEYKKRQIHSANLIASIDHAHAFSLLFFTLTIVIGTVTTIYILSNISRRINTMVQLAENISGGNFTHIVDNNKDEMTSLSNSLNIMSDKLNKNISTLEKQNAELDTFAYVVSHDLKAPIRGISNVIAWIEEDFKDELSPELKKQLHIIPQRTKRMEDLINGLLAYARTREKTSSGRTNVFEMVNEIVKSIVPRNVKVRLEYLPTFITDSLKLEQVFTNLISNAVKHIDPDKGEITISCRKNNTFYEFSVKDNGCGIEEEYHARIFEMFQTLREKNEAESTGIGLALIKKILDDKHCTIWVNSTLGNGAEFVFTWPI